MIRKLNPVCSFLVGFILLFPSCSSDDGDVTMPQNPGMPKALQGTFISEAHPTSGTASINEENTILSFVNFKTDTGPKLEVWMATSRTPSDASTYKSLGVLKGIEGNYTYDLPDNVDYSKYNHVVIWCVDFSVSFGYAIVK